MIFILSVLLTVRAIPLVEEAVSEANIAYFIQISDSNIALLPRLLRSIWHYSNTYLIHFDKKIPEFQRTHARASLFKKRPKFENNVHIMESEIVTYRGISMVLNILSAFQSACDVSEDWDYFINISGSDYPLVSAENQRRLLASRDFLERNRSFFSFSEKEWWDESHKYRFNNLYMDTSLAFNESTSVVLNSNVDHPLTGIHNFTFVAAETWMILHRTYVEYVLKSSVARRMLLAFTNVLEPEEHYFASLAYMVPEFNATNVPHAMRHVVWVHNGEHSGQHPYYVDAQEDDGKTWTFRPGLQESGCFFARKFRIQNSGLMTYLDIHVNGISKDSVDGDVKKYLGKVNEMLDCITPMASGEYGVECFVNEDDIDGTSRFRRSSG